MIGGPETDLARGIADVPVMTSTTGGAPVIPPPEDGATAQGNMFSAPSPDAFTIPGQSKSQQLQMGPAQYAWQPGQEGFGQGDVQRYGFDTGMVPVAEMKLPFGALASRGQALAERKQQNQQAQKALIEKFDPYGGVGKAADPFQPAFGKYARGQIDKLAADIAAAYGGDTGEAYRRMATPGTEEYMLLKSRSQELQDIATENRFVYGKFADMLALDMARERTLDPDIKEDIIRFLSALDENGVPVEGVDPSEFRTKRRDLEARISMSQFMKNFMDRLPSMVQAQTQEFARAKSVGGGRYGLEEVTIKDFEPAIDFYAKQYSDASMGKVSVEQAKAQMRQVFNDEIKRSMATWSPRADSGGRNENKDDTPQAPRVVAGLSEAAPRSIIPYAPGGVTPSGWSVGSAQNLRLTPIQTTGEKPHKVAKMSVVDKNKGVDLYTPALEWDDARSEFVIRGRDLSAEDKQKLSRILGSEVDAAGNKVETFEAISTQNLGRQRSVLTKHNKDVLETYYGTRDEYEVIARVLNDRGVEATADQVKAIWGDKSKRKSLIEKLGQ